MKLSNIIPKLILGILILVILSMIIRPI